MEQPPHPPPVLPEEIVEEILLRFPPEDPASLVHAALVCKPWYGIISGDGFCRRFREFHRAAQMLGFFCNVLDARFIPTSSFRPPHAGRFYAFEARHGRVLLDPGYDGEEHFIVVWDPITDERWEVPVPFPEAFRELELENWNATVLCAATASGSCNHHDCHGGPFMVVYLGPMLEPELMSFHVYPSEADSWSQQTSVPNYHWVDEEVLTALVGSTLYFSMDHSTRALSYDLATLETSVIHLPPKPVECDTATALMAMKNGGLGVARLDEAAKLSLWSMEVNVNSNGDMGWTQIKVIELDKVLPVNACSICSGFLSFAQGVGVFFIGTYDGLFTFDLMSGRARKVFEEPCDEIGILGVVPCVVPFVSFYTPGDRTAPTIAALEAYRFDKVRPVRDSMIDAVRVWKKLTGEDANAEGRNKDLADGEGKLDSRRSMQRGGKPESFDDSSPDSPSSNVKGSSIAEKAAVLLKKRPTLTDRELNPEFFQKLETRKTDDLAVEVVVRRKTLQSHLRSEDETEEDDDPVGPADSNGSAEDEANLTQMCASSNFQNIQDKWAGQRGNRNKDTKARTADVEDRVEPCTKDSTAATMNIPGEGPFINNKTNWLAIQRQLSHLERQQTSLMNMLQDFMGGAHDSMVTLENRVHGLERVVEEMAREISLSSGRRGGGPALGFDSSLGRSSKYNGVHEYSNSKFGRSSDGRMGFAERYFSADSMASGTKNPSWRPDSEPCMNVRRGLDSVSSDNRMTRNERSNDQAGPRRGWDKGQGPFRFCEGPSARSAWRASKDEATLEAIRVAGEDHGNSMAAARVAIPGLDGEALNDDNQGDERGPLWEAWTRAMDAVHLEDMDSAYAEVLSTGDAELLVKLMEQTGPVVDQLSNEVANEVLHAVGQFLVEECFYDVALNWLQQVKSMHYYVCPDMVDWEAWTRAMDAVHLEDIDSAYAEVLSTGDAELLVKLMQQTGPVVDQLSNEVANEVLHAVGQFLVEECFYDVALNWLQQLTDLVMENGSDYLGIPLDAKQDLLLVLHEATAIELPDDWEGATPMQIMKQLASSWRIDLQNLSIRVTYIDCRHMG